MRSTATAIAAVCALVLGACAVADSVGTRDIADDVPTQIVQPETPGTPGSPDVGTAAPTASEPTADEPTVRPTREPTATEPTLAPTALPDPTMTALPSATAAPPTAVPTAEPEPQASGPCDAAPLAAPNPDRPIYDVALVVNPTAGTVRGDMTVQFVPDLATDRIVLRLWPNSPRHRDLGGSMELDPVIVDGQPMSAAFPDPTTAVIELDEAVAAGETVVLATGFDLALPGEGRSRLSHRVDYQRLGTIIPLLPWEPGRGWAEEPPTSLFAESVSSPVATWQVAIDVPDGYDVLASGIDDGTGTWRLDVGRDFAISIGRFTLFTGTALAPEPVTVTVGVHETVNDNGQAYLDKVIDSLEQFSSRWGAYPWSSLTFAITPNLGGGIEFPTHIMQGPNTIGRTTSHEVGHMYFYSLVGNNQATAPWLDEGLTSYAEFTYEGVGPGAYEIPVEGQGRAAEPMTWFEGRPDLYYRSVYGQTGFALQRLADRSTVDCALAHYVAANAHRIATPADFVTAFEPWVPSVRADLTALGVDLTAAG